MGSNPAAPTTISLENKEKSASPASAPKGQNGTERRRSAGIGTKSPEKVPNAVQLTFSPVDFPKELRKLAEAVERIGRFRDPEDAVMAQLAIIERLEEMASHFELTVKD